MLTYNFFKDCGMEQYGADCEQTCSSNCRNNKCDQYTGICNQGCSEGYLPPLCLQSKIIELNSGWFNNGVPISI